MDIIVAILAVNDVLSNLNTKTGENAYRIVTKVVQDIATTCVQICRYKNTTERTIKYSTLSLEKVASGDKIFVRCTERVAQRRYNKEQFEYLGQLLVL